MKTNNTLIATLFLCLGLTFAQAQQATSSAGGNASGAGGTISYSIGLIMYTTLTGSTGSVAQGIQDAYEIKIVSGIEDAQVSLNIQAYPNPTTDYLTLHIGNDEFSNLNFQLYGINGKLVENKKISSMTETINMENLPSAVYFLKVANNNTEVKTFKIIKN